MSMTPRERVLAAVNHEQPDRVPLIIGVSNATGIRMKPYRGIKQLAGIRAPDEYLYESDIVGLVPENTSIHDSIVLVRNYINNWVQTQLMVQQAKKNLVIQQLDLDKQLENYRNSLIIYHYETELIRQKLDTVVSEQQVETYYNSHLGDFELKAWHSE